MFGGTSCVADDKYSRLVLQWTSGFGVCDSHPFFLITISPVPFDSGGSVNHLASSSLQRGGYVTQVGQSRIIHESHAFEKEKEGQCEWGIIRGEVSENEVVEGGKSQIV